MPGDIDVDKRVCLNFPPDVFDRVLPVFSRYHPDEFEVEATAVTLVVGPSVGTLGATVLTPGVSNKAFSSRG